MVLPFPETVGQLPMAPRSGIMAPKKGTPRSTFPGGWDRECAGCGESKPPLGKKSQTASMCLQEQFRLYNGRPPHLLRGPRYQSQGHISPLPFAILAKTFLADSATAHE